MIRIVLVESDEHLPALFPFRSWEALIAADRVWARDPATHPSAPHLALAAVDLERLQPAELDLRGLDLSEPGSPSDRRYARALIDRAAAVDGVTYLLGPDDPDSFTRAVGLAVARQGGELEFVFHEPPPGHQVLRLAAVERRLRDPDRGCPWDLEQDHATLARYLVEETSELLDAIAQDDDQAIAEELGDVLLQVVFHAQIAADRAAFDLDDVARGIADKLVRRHPHVFADVDVSGPDEVMANWDELKRGEKPERGALDVPASLPALQLVDELQRRGAKHGAEWPGADDPEGAMRARLDALADAPPGDQEDLIGDLLAAGVALARARAVDPELALRRAAARFRAQRPT